MKRLLPVAVAVLVWFGGGGCGQLWYRLRPPTPEHFVPNPLELPPVADEFLWLQVVDTIDDYFRVAQQQPCLRRGSIVLDGNLQSSYRVGASYAEPWRKDSVRGFERLQSSLQSIRRRALVTVRPTPVGYNVEVIVQKDLEDTDRTQYATETTAGNRQDVSRVSRADDFEDSPQTLGWIPLGRDNQLEQVLLHDLLGRVTRPDAKH